jgi:hypothetical protein
MIYLKRTNDNVTNSDIYKLELMIIFNKIFKCPQYFLLRKI